MSVLQASLGCQHDTRLSLLHCHMSADLAAINTSRPMAPTDGTSYIEWHAYHTPTCIAKPQCSSRHVHAGDAQACSKTCSCSGCNNGSGTNSLHTFMHWVTPHVHFFKRAGAGSSQRPLGRGTPKRPAAWSHPACRCLPGHPPPQMACPRRPWGCNGHANA